MPDALGEAFSIVFSPSVIGIILLSGTYGLFVGAIPGLTATMAVALIIPFTFFMSPPVALAAISTLSAMAIFAGDIPSTLMRIPGTPASAAYVADAYALNQRGEGSRVLGVCLVFSAVGGLLGGIALILGAPTLARVAFAFTTYEYFWLAILGLSSAVIVSQGSLAKGCFSLLLGLLLSTVGLDEVHGMARMTFGLTDLAGGINFIPAMIGMFGLSEVLRNVTRREAAADLSQVDSGVVFQGTFRLLRRRLGHFLRSSSIGILIGILPGAGADIAAWVSFATSKKFSKTPNDYGKGSLEGISDASAANNSSLGGAWIPALVFGIPGDAVTAIVLGVLMMKGIQPSPQIFVKQPVLLYSVYIVFFVSNLLLIPMGYLAIRCSRIIIRIPRGILLPAILLFCMVGSYAINTSLFDIGLMLIFGVVGFFLERHGFPVGPVVLGLVLGPQVEKNFMFSVIKSDGNFMEFFSRPVAGTLGSIVCLLWLAPALLALRRWSRRRSRAFPGGRPA